MAYDSVLDKPVAVHKICNFT